MPLKNDYAATGDPLTAIQADAIATQINTNTTAITTPGFTFTQSSAAATWTITNTLGRYPKAVTVMVGGFEVDADVETPNTSTIVITFATAQSGRAEII